MRIGVGATLVRHSDPDSEVAETRAKAAGLLASIGAAPGPGSAVPERYRTHPAVLRALAGRNEKIARFWLDAGVPPPPPGTRRWPDARSSSSTPRTPSPR